MSGRSRRARDSSVAATMHTEPTTPRVQVHRGTITLIGGCMFSGKTTALLTLVDAAEPGQAAVFKPLLDTRYSANAVVSHGGKSCPATVIASPGEILEKLPSNAATVAVDEVHFFDIHLAPVAEALRDKGIDVILTALDLDSWGRPFPAVERLAAVADTRGALRATCARCGAEANHTQRTTPIEGGNMVGGAESYEPRCPACWHPPRESPPRRDSQ